MVQDWTETDAFKLGIIDAKGNFLKKYSQLKTAKERLAFSTLHRFAFNLKKIIESLPGGKSKISKYLTVWALFREQFDAIEGENKDVNLLFEEKFSPINTLFDDEFGGNKTSRRK